jgi:hypothetical protein
MICLHFACATHPAQKPVSERIRFDSKLIQPYSFDLEKTKPVESPFVAHYQNGTNELLFIAAHHISVRESSNLHEHPTIKTIGAVFNSQSPEAAIIEGVPSGDELSPQWYIEYARKCERRDYRNCSESAYLAYLADQTHIPFMSGEASDLKIKTGILEEGFAEEDLLGFYVARMLPQHFREDKTFGYSDMAMKKAIESDLLQSRRDLKSDLKFGYNDFIRWLKKNSPGPIRRFAKSANECAPVATGTRLQKISFQVDVIRNRTLLKRIEMMFRTHEKVLVIYGSGHFLSLKPALEAVLGKANIEKKY